MNKKSIIVGASALLLTGLVLTPGLVQAYRGDPAVQGPNYSEERHTQMTAAFENKDYNAWKNLIQGRGRVSQVVNADNFPKFVEAHQYALEGNLDEANKIRAELGLGLGNGSGKSTGQGQGYGRNRQ